MGREVRRVSKNWQHPRRDDGNYKPLYDAIYASRAAEFMEMANAKGLKEAVEYFGSAPNPDDYMPDWPDNERTHLMMYEDTSEGTPISPAFETPEELARWLVDNKASAFGDMTATYEQWLSVARGGWAPSMVVAGGKMMSGVEAAEELKQA